MPGWRSRPRLQAAVHLHRVAGAVRTVQGLYVLRWGQGVRGSRMAAMMLRRGQVRLRPAARGWLMLHTHLCWWWVRDGSRSRCVGRGPGELVGRTMLGPLKPALLAAFWPCHAGACRAVTGAHVAASTVCGSTSACTCRGCCRGVRLPCMPEELVMQRMCWPGSLRHCWAMAASQGHWIILDRWHVCYRGLRLFPHICTCTRSCRLRLVKLDGIHPHGCNGKESTCKHVSICAGLIQTKVSGSLLA